MKDIQYYLICYGKGTYEDYRVHEKFITDDLELAVKWVDKYNRILKSFTEHYNAISDIYSEEDTDYGRHLTDRYYQIDEYGKAFYKIIEKR